MVKAAGESDKISERTRDGKQRRANRGRVHGGHRGYGMPGWFSVGADWERGDPRDPIPAEQVAFERGIIRECYERIFVGDTLASLVYDLNARGVRTAEGNSWTTTTLSATLCRPSAAGLLRFRGKVVGTLVRVEPIVSAEDWHRMVAIFDGRRRGRPITPVHMLSGTIRCTRCGQMMYALVRNSRKGNREEAPREYRCHKTANRPKACGSNVIDARYAEASIEEAVKARLGDPRRSERVARHLTRVRDERGKLEIQKAVLQKSADGLSQKVATWGLERVDMGMGPILVEIEKIDRKLASLKDEETDEAATEDAARTWDEAYGRGDVQALRAMVKRAFPRLAIRPHERRLHHTADRFDWDGKDLPNPLP
jgi:hypothetical protein